MNIAYNMPLIGTILRSNRCGGTIAQGVNFVCLAFVKNDFPLVSSNDNFQFLGNVTETVTDRDQTNF